MISPFSTRATLGDQAADAVTWCLSPAMTPFLPGIPLPEGAGDQQALERAALLPGAAHARAPSSRRTRPTHSRARHSRETSPSYPNPPCRRASRCTPSAATKRLLTLSRRARGPSKPIELSLSAQHHPSERGSPHTPDIPTPPDPTATRRRRPRSTRATPWPSTRRRRSSCPRTVRWRPCPSSRRGISFSSPWMQAGALSLASHPHRDHRMRCFDSISSPCALTPLVPVIVWNRSSRTWRGARRPCSSSWAESTRSSTSRRARSEKSPADGVLCLQSSRRAASACAACGWM